MVSSSTFVKIWSNKNIFRKKHQKKPVSPIFPTKHDFSHFLAPHIEEKVSKIQNVFRKSFFKPHSSRKPNMMVISWLPVDWEKKPPKKKRFSYFSDKLKILADCNILQRMKFWDIVNWPNPENSKFFQGITDSRKNIILIRLNVR